MMPTLRGSDAHAFGVSETGPVEGCGAIQRCGSVQGSSARVGYERPGFAFLLNAPALIGLILLSGYPIVSSAADVAGPEEDGASGRNEAAGVARDIDKVGGRAALNA